MAILPVEWSHSMLVHAAYNDNKLQRMIFVLKIWKNNGWSVVVEDLETHNEREKPKLRTKKYGKTRGVAKKKLPFKSQAKLH